MNTKFNLYLRSEKIKWIHKFSEDFNKDFGVELPHGTGFTKSDFFHFAAVDGKKYVHKEAMKFVLTNGGTYSEHQERPIDFKLNSNLKETEKIDLNIARMFNFFRNDINQYKLYPAFLSETEHFFIFKYYDSNEWTSLDILLKKDSEYIKKSYVRYIKGTNEVVTPFFNQMINKLFRNNSTGEIIMVDLKSLEFRPKSNLSILMYNGRINELYLLERFFWTKSFILRPYAIDYPVKYTQLIKHY